jgi:hypothetical protein
MNIFGEMPIFTACTGKPPALRSARKISLLAGLFLLIALVLGPGANGQEVTGAIAGTVTDPSGAPISGAKVTINDIATNAVRTVVTSEIGSYKVAHLAPGHYTVKIEANAFKSSQQDNVTVAIDQVVEINAALKVGSKQEVIEVTTETPVLQTEQSSVGLVIDSNNLQNTPLNGRLSLLGLMILAPGIQNLATAQDTIPAFGVTLSVGTGRRNSYGGMATTLDGTINEQVSLQRSEAEVPSIDALEEFKIITNGAPAEYGQAGQIVVASKSGANSFHGEALEYNRSKGTGAKTYSFTPRATTPARAPYERNEYGGNFSGPISIPHLYNGKDRSFFFAAYEGYHLTNSSNVSTVQPTALQRTGDFSEFLAGGVCDFTKAKTGTTITDPLNSSAVITNNNMSAYISPITKQLLNILYPTPTTSGCGVNTFETIDYTQKAERFSMRLDHKLSDNDQLRGTFLRAFYGPYPFSFTDSKQGGYSAEGEHNVNSILGWTHTFTPSLLLDTTGSYLHLIVVRQPHVDNVEFGSIIPGLGALQFGGAPSISISQLSGTSITSTGDSGGGHPGLEQDIQFNTSLIKLLARHTLKTGFSYIHSNYYANSPVSSGSFTFGNGSGGGYSGIAFADFMFGLPTTSGNGTPGMYAYRDNESQYGAYIQDDWKILPKLTLNYGLRYDLQWFESDVYGHNSLYVPEQQKLVVFGNSIPSAAVSSYVNTLTTAGRIETSAAANMSSDPWSYLGRPVTNFGPRFGFAYEVMPKTVVRGAYGIYYNLIATQYTNTEINNLPFTAAVTYSNSAAATSNGYFTMNDAFTATGKYNANPSVGAQAKSKTPYTETYNLAIERELGKGYDLRIGYVGQHNLKQNNVQGPGTTALNLNVTANPIIYTTTAQGTYNVQPFSSITLNTIPYFHSTMDSLEVGLHKQYNHGLMVNAEYQWTRILGVENVENPSGANLNDSYGPASGTTPQVLNLNYTYELPVGKGKFLLGNAGSLVNSILGGWQWSGVGTFQTGQPFSVNASTPSKTVGLSSSTYRANRVPGVALYPHNKSKAQWFNPAAFTQPGTYVGSDGNTYVNIGTSGYDMLRGPGWWNADMNLVKNIHWSERYNVQLRADSFNIFNHAKLGTPNATIPLTGNTSSTLGTITSTASTPVYEARTVEFGAKFNF